MPQPSNATVTVDGNKFNAHSAHVGLETVHDHTGMPMMGTPRYIIECSVNAHDTENLPFATLQNLFSIASVVTKESIKDIKIEFWTDETQNDAICTYSFRGWISEFHTAGGGGCNHSLHLTFVPELAQNQYVNIKMGN
ncbi:MAG: hypothetical protein ABR905_20365 [Terracidiphilus sp.]|jgi:hypothetical protein